MNLDELIIYLGSFTKQQIYQLVHLNEIPFKNNGRLEFDKKEIDKWNKNRLENLKKDREYLTLQELIAYIEPPLKKRTIYQWVCEGKIPHSKRGKFLRFKKTEIDEWDKQGRPVNF